ncbi:hypothetical protein G6729_07265 [Polynucleobacter paneuropaeus]|nr:hypothetical protein G6729_07265 [Polynucleobacter paneuropaeus]
MSKLQNIRNYLAGILFLPAVALSLWPLRATIIEDMFWHMDIQIPLLIVVGAMIKISAPALHETLSRFNAYGLNSFIASQVILAFWMLPISIDRAIIHWEYDLAKIISLIMCGWLIQVSFKKTTLVIELFFIGYFLAMMLWVGVYYIQSDVRLCNVYTQESQQYAGGGLIFYAVMLSLILIISKLNKKMAAHNKLLLKG